MHPELTDYLAKHLSPNIERYFTDVIDEFYQQVVTLNAQHSASLFAEKMLPGSGQVNLIEIYGNRLKEIFLVRDFRDVIASIIAFNRKRGYAEFSRQFFSSDADFVRGFAAQATGLLEDWEARRDHSLLVRYEDMATNFPASLKEVFTYLELEADACLLRRIAEECAPERDRDGNVAAHMTSNTVAASVGRWCQDLAPELQRLANASLSRTLDSFGYGVAPVCDPALPPPSPPVTEKVGNVAFGPGGADRRAEIFELRVAPDSNEQAGTLSAGGSARVTVCVGLLDSIDAVSVGIQLATADGAQLWSLHTHEYGVRIEKMSRGDAFTVEFLQPLPLRPGRYCLTVAVGDATSLDYAVCDLVAYWLYVDVALPGPDHMLTRSQPAVSLVI
jgi:hypothetical protein